MRATIFGARGGIGRHVVDHAAAAGHTLRLFVRDRSKLEAGHAAHRVIEGTMDDRRAVADAVAGADGVINALGPTANRPEEVASSASWRTPASCARHRSSATDPPLR